MQLSLTSLFFFLFFSLESVDDLILYSTKNHTSWEFGKSETYESPQPNRRKRREKRRQKTNIRIIDDNDDEHVSNAGWLL